MPWELLHKSVGILPSESQRLFVCSCFVMFDLLYVHVSFFCVSSHSIIHVSL